MPLMHMNSTMAMIVKSKIVCMKEPYLISTALPVGIRAET